ncbi:MAG: DUF4173 domain-containing protein [Bacteroidales bacterium]|nr:DUF4173 domain-containing protein [Bacteroidales bacterium]
MKRLAYIFASVATALVFTMLFFEKSIGLNLVILEWITIPIMLILNRPFKFNKLTITALLILLTTSLAVLYSHSGWTIFVNILMFFTCNSIIVFKNYRSYMFATFESFRNAALAFVPQMNRKHEDGEPKMKKSKVFWLTVLAFVITLAFIILYSLGSSKFGDWVSDIIQSLDFEFIVLFLVGLVFANYAFRKKTEKLMTYESGLEETLVHKRKRRFLRGLSQTLKNRNYFGVVLLGMLNIVLLFFNISDVRYVWLYSWDGSFLKEFVHEGTWILSFAILISQMIALLFFRENLNFYSRNKLLKILTMIWLAQNCFMTLSVGLRNFWYVKYFGLAFGRITVFFFLVLVIVGLISIMIKVSRRKSMFYLFKVNSYAFMVVISLSALVNWNIVIADYNFAHSDSAFIEYSFMAKLDNSALPYLVKTREELDLIDQQQQQAMKFDTRQDYFISSKKYEILIKMKIREFVDEYESQNILEWNYADEWAYRKLKKSGFADDTDFNSDWFDLLR